MEGQLNYIYWNRIKYSSWQESESKDISGFQYHSVSISLLLGSS